MKTQEKLDLVDCLKNLLKEQIELSRQGSPAGEPIIALSERSDCLVKQIQQTGILEEPEMKRQKKQIEELYNCLYLSLSAQKAEVKDSLNLIRKGRKTVEMYRNHI